MSLAQFTHPALILPNLQGRDVPSVIQELSQALQHEHRIPDLLRFYHAALNREFLGSTDMEADMAFPHARLPELKTLSFAFGRTPEPLPWGPRTARPVRMIFLMAVPATESTQYLQVVSALARLGGAPDLVQALLAAQDSFQIMEVFQRLPVRGGSRLNLPPRALSS